jgi:beta-glucosidase
MIRPERPRFPDGFWWGTGNSSNQCEGAAPAGDWLPWERANHAPPSGDGNGFARRYGEDFTLLAGIGLNHFRLSLEWARLEPAEGNHDQAEIERYRALLQAARDAGISIWLTAHHFTLPVWFAAMGSFGDHRARTYYWRRHVEFLAETFGELVYGWKPINEPHAYAMCGWLLGVIPPGRKSMAEAARMLIATHLANHEAWLALRGGGKPVATIHNLSPSIAATHGEADQQAAATVDDLAFGCWIRMIRDGVLELPALPGLPAPERIEDPAFAGAFDLVGFSYYHAASVRANPSPASSSGATLGAYPADGKPGPLGYVPWSGGLRLVLDRLHADLPGKPLVISEYGIGTADDAERCQFIQDGLDIAADAIGRGVDLRGFFHWTGVDNYEWGLGFSAQFGLFGVDRSPRPSAQIIADCARARTSETSNRDRP